MKFEDKSVFEYENKKIRMTDGGVMARQAEIDRRKLESKK
ncbi:conserved hypothetical protein [Enterobacterales bacterium 8AC]|nr:conserved hypothetical protein [Enterobacterales bacterium 8AC]